jgi:Co/Zn/Cd efflux system component
LKQTFDSPAELSLIRSLAPEPYLASLTPASFVGSPAQNCGRIKYKDGDANVRSVWLCSRNDAIGNVAVMVAAFGVWGTARGWPDLVVAAILASLFLNSAIKILRQALDERWAAKERASLDVRDSKVRTVRRKECTS